MLRGGQSSPRLVPGADTTRLRASPPSERTRRSCSRTPSGRPGAFRARIPLRAGASLSWRGFLLTHRDPADRARRRASIPTAHLLRDVAGLFGINVPSLHPRLCFDAADAREARAALAERGLLPGERYAVACPGAASAPPSSGRLGLRAASTRSTGSAACAVVTAAGEEALCDEVAARTRHGAVSLAAEERDLARLKALVRGPRLLLVGDSGPRWYAAAFDVPCVTVMGPNHPLLTASSLEWCAVVRKEDLDCSPCMERVCPLGHHACLRELPPQRVLEAAGELLGAAG